jgi:cytochrome b
VGSEESIKHLLLRCEVAHELWSYILTLFGVEWVMPRSVLELSEMRQKEGKSMDRPVGYGPAKEVWRLVSLCLMWCIWQEQNARLFEDVETSMVELQKHLLNTLYI